MTRAQGARGPGSVPGTARAAPSPKNASAGNRTRVTLMATMYSTTRPTDAADTFWHGVYIIVFAQIEEPRHDRAEWKITQHFCNPVAFQV